MPDRLAIAFATSQDVPALTEDDKLLVRALNGLGVKAGPVIWSDEKMQWSLFSAVLIRSCWDYHRRHAEFIAWVDRLEGSGTRVFNPPALVRWNAEKTYLRDLAAQGVDVVPTRFVSPGEKTTLAAVMKAEKWEDAVVKPAVSASAHETWRSTATSAAADEARFQALAARGMLLVQPYVRAIETEGEWSLLFYAGSYSHAVLKRPAPGDFRVQKEHGGTAEPVVPPGQVIDSARRVVREACKKRPDSLYARVDGCVVDGHFALMELELIEPDLFMRSQPGAPERLASALLAAVR